jgi:hypothetical protein
MIGGKAAGFEVFLLKPARAGFRLRTQIVTE